MRYKDPNGLDVDLAYKSPTDQQNAKHVLGIPIFNNEYVLTHHKLRGIEFPGGKVEPNETNKEAVQRELYEETGAIAKTITFIASYTVHDTIPFNKDVYFIEVESMDSNNAYFETYGPVIAKEINDIPEEEKSFLLKDTAILKCVERVYKLGFLQ
ncbi:nucleoside triphosphatase YtkD [Mammaliicoccus sciuri]|uniref:RNA deprotection pyrophosphohydrolase n=1 Tax=Mammaliicoccus sciuri TaxID=1296 RepID=UPI0021D37494|nr:nucleoside triphosphatase YtkD [Mammaliicoccus sciuri]UXU84839.1 nucleoside triphosphatase YtkD [Mammaliicoccus sciuri]UXU94686.1 nucleoside triphosphatase YtkD [Mammaliicoccus sciuri]UXV16635.1 nucleoside triphosphatase YtkD [Mammaliicoccus sciuri]UXV24895.1 nucleoside triphosphatase YtkD [Mammaliicoccus sciuri]UXV27681.1 nucleoside triphosphatase YtkD [Mammaliicoccus sciuri]